MRGWSGPALARATTTTRRRHRSSWAPLLGRVALRPVPSLPVAPAFGYLTAVLVGPPYTTGTGEYGWPRIGEVTPGSGAVTPGVPGLLSSLVVALPVAVAARSRDQGE